VCAALAGAAGHRCDCSTGPLNGTNLPPNRDHRSPPGFALSPRRRERPSRLRRGRDLTQMRNRPPRPIAAELVRSAGSLGISALFYFLGSLAYRSSEIGTGLQRVEPAATVVTPAASSSTPLYRLSRPTFGKVTGDANHFVGGDVNLRHGLRNGSLSRATPLAAIAHAPRRQPCTLFADFSSPLVPFRGIISDDSRSAPATTSMLQVAAPGLQHGQFPFELQSTVRPSV